MSEVKTLKGRVIHKHKTEAQWYLDVYTTAGGTTKRTEPFVPKKGELIIYDPDSVYEHYRFKIGDDEKDVVALPFWQGNPAELSTTNKTIIEAINELKGRVDALPTTDSNTAHSHSAGGGLSISGTGGLTGTTTYTLASPTKNTGVSTSYVTAMAADGNQQYYSEDITMNNEGQVGAKSCKIDKKATIQYNTTEGCLEFSFS